MIKGMAGQVVSRFPHAYNEIVTNAKETFVFERGIWKPVIRVSFHSPEIHFVIQYIIARLAVAGYYFQTGQPLPAGTQIEAIWRPHVQPFDDSVMKSVLSSLAGYQTLAQGNMKADTQFEYRFAIPKEGHTGAFAFHFHQAFLGIAFVNVGEPSMRAESLGLFHITQDGIEPVNSDFPPHVRIVKRSEGGRP